MASGYGRGGRGAALLQLLKEPVRKPGDASPPPAEPSPPVMAPSQAIGRGALMQQLLQQEKSVPVQAVVTPSVLLGRGQSMGRGAPPPSPAVPSTGRGAALLQGTTGHIMPIGRGALAASTMKSGPGTPPHTATGPSQSPEKVAHPAPSASPTVHQEEDPDSLSRLGYMLQRLDMSKRIERHGKKGEEIPLSANYIPIKCKNKGFYQYAVSFTPPVDSRSMRSKLLYEHNEVIGATRIFDGAILFLPIKLPSEETVLTSVRPTDSQNITLRVKLARVLPPEAFAQPLNIIFRKIMYQLRMCQVGRHYYDPSRPAPVPQHKLEVWPGYITAVAEYEGGLMLLVDVSHRVLRTETVLDIIAVAVRSNPQNYKKVIMDKILGKVVLTRYNNKTYSVDDILWDKSPSSTFTTSAGETLSFRDYYKKHYNKEIKDLDQPLLVHRPKPKEQERQRGRKPPLEMICLIPELSYITGLSDEIRQDFKIMKDLACHTRVSPAQRQMSFQKFCQNVNSNEESRQELEKWGMELDLNTIQLMGRKLPEEKIQFARKTFPAGDEADWGRWLGKDHVLTPVPLKNWLVVFTKSNANTVRGFIQQMEKDCPSMGWSCSHPNMQELSSDRTEGYLAAIRNNLNEHVQLVVAIFPTSRDDRYNAFKKLCCTQLPVPSQVIINRTISKPAKLRSVVQKIALQINCKLGGELWAVSIPTSNLMVCGIDTFHAPGNKKNSIGGFVASLNRNCTRWYSKVCHQVPGQELIDGLKVCMLSSLRKYHEVNHSLPDKIVVFRDGVGDGQLRVVADHEVKQLSSCFANMGESYQPKLAVIVVQKRINTRIFKRERNGQLANPAPGTVIDHTINRKDWYDFFLVSQHVRQGTVTPTHYIVVHDETDWKPDAMQALSYKMTHMYYNWPGTVRVPAPCQYAHKLAYLIGQNVHKDPSPELADKLFFL